MKFKASLPLQKAFFRTFLPLVFISSPVWATESRQLIFYSSTENFGIARVFNDENKVMRFDKCTIGSELANLKTAEVSKKLDDGTLPCTAITTGVQIPEDTEAERFDLLMNYNISKIAGQLVEPDNVTDLRRIQLFAGLSAAIAASVRYSVWVTQRMALKSGVAPRPVSRMLRMGQLASLVVVAGILVTSGIEASIYHDRNMKDSSIEELLPLSFAQISQNENLPIALSPAQKNLITPALIREVLERALTKTIEDFNSL